LVILVDIKTLNFIENPDIASIPEASEGYFQNARLLHLLSWNTFTSQSTFTNTRGDDEASLLLASSTISKAY
jgi:hypothetical protein